MNTTTNTFTSASMDTNTNIFKDLSMVHYDVYPSIHKTLDLENSGVVSA